MKKFFEDNKGWALGDPVRCSFIFKNYMLLMVFVFPFFFVSFTKDFGDYLCDWIWSGHLLALIVLVGGSPDSSAL